MPWLALKPDQKFMELDGLSTNIKQITSHEMLKKELTKLWLEIPIKMIQNFIESMRR